MTWLVIGGVGVAAGTLYYGGTIAEYLFTRAIESSAEKLAKGLGKGMEKMGEEIAKNIHKINFDINSAIASSMFLAWAPYIALGTSIPLGCKYVYEVYKEKIGKPSMQIETNQSSWFGSIGSWWSKKTEKPRPVFKPELREQIDDVTGSSKMIAKHGGAFEWVLLHGPAGTGKTMVANEIAEKSGMKFYILSAAELSVFIQKGTHITELNKFLDAVENAGGPAVIFLDEFDAIGQERSKLDQAHLEIQTTLLSRTGAGSKKIMVVAATNRKDILDPAIVNRFTHKIKIDPPDLQERVDIIRQNVKLLFTPQEILQFFSEGKIHEIAEKIEGFSGRSIFQLINTIYNKKATTQDGKLTQRIIDQKVALFIEQEKPSTLQKSPESVSPRLLALPVVPAQSDSQSSS